MIRLTHHLLGTTIMTAVCATLLSLSLVTASFAQSADPLPAGQDQLTKVDVPDDVAQSPPSSTEGEAAHRQREGTRLANQQGYFRATGEGLTFHLSGAEEKYPGLENLALERIAKIMSDRHDHPDQLVWEVSGFFTEFRGGNYLFITHAVLKNKSRRRRATP